MDTPQNNQQSANHPGSDKLGGPAEKNMVMGILAYIGPLVILSFLLAKDDPFVKFHIKQGAVLFVIEIAAWVISMMIWPLAIFMTIVNLGVFVLAILGIVNVVKGVEKELPIVGKFSKYATF